MGEAKDRIMTSGLEDVVVATTRLSHVDGEAGRLVIAGYPVEELAPNVSFEEMAFLLLFGNLPSPAEQQKFRARLASHRQLPPAVQQVLVAAARDQATRLPSWGSGVSGIWGCSSRPRWVLLRWRLQEGKTRKRWQRSSMSLG